MQRLNDEMDNRWVDKISTAEQLPDDSWVTRPTSLGGAGFDSQWHDAFVDNLRQEIFDAASGDPEVWKIRNIINGSGTNLSNVKVINYFETHDEAWPSSGGQRVVKTIDTTYPHDDDYAKGRTKLAQGIVMFAPGIPIILQGTEWLEDIDFGSGSTEGADRIDWSKKTTYANIFKYYKDIIGLRRANCGMRADAGHNVFHEDESGNVIAFSRGDGAELVVVANFSNTNYSSYNIDFPAGGTWYELLNSQASDYDGNGWGNGGSVYAASESPHTASVVVPWMSVLVFRHEDPRGRSSDLEGSDGDVDLLDLRHAPDPDGQQRLRPGRRPERGRPSRHRRLPGDGRQLHRAVLAGQSQQPASAPDGNATRASNLGWRAHAGVGMLTAGMATRA